MPTLPLSENEPHRQRQIAESFGAVAERYDRARPDYPRALVDRIIASSPGTDVLDVGIGTGIAARQFRAAGCRVLGVDVDARMADRARRHGLEVEVAAFEAWDPAGRTFDAVIAAQTWHWVDPVVGAAKAAELLRPGGRLAVFWNVAHLPPDVAEAFAEVYRRLMPDSLAARWAGTSGGSGGGSVLITKAIDGIREAGAFDDPEQWQVDWQRSYTRDELLDQLGTTGAHTHQSPAELEQVQAAIGAAIDGLGGSVTTSYDAMVLSAARSGAR